jgi:uncharacterized protein (TIGR02246 family)
MSYGTTEAEAIRDLLAAYALTLDVDDLDGCLELFTEDGEFQVYGKRLSREQIRKMFTRAPRGMHMTGAALIDVRGDAAAVRSQVLFVDSSTHQMRPALYDDDLSKVDGRWRFARRRCQFLTEAGLADSPQEPAR